MVSSYFDKLTPGQQKLSYAKYIDYPYPDPAIPGDVAAKIAGSMDPAKALPLARVRDLLDPGYDADDTGYCILGDGSGYIGETIRFPGAAREMFAWWFAWHGMEELRYRIWDPEAHVASSVSAGHLAKRLDASLPWISRIVDTAHFTTHIARDGSLDRAVMCFVSPEAFGLDTAQPGVGDMTVVAALHGQAGAPLPSLSSVRVLRDTAEGFVMRIYFWQGIFPAADRIIRLGNTIDLADTEHLAAHCAREYNRLASILPSIYAENHDIQYSAEAFHTVDL